MKLKSLSLLCFFAVAAPAAAGDVIHAAEAGVGKGLNMFFEIYKVEGMAGIETAVEECYKSHKATPTVEGLGTCASLDRRAKDEDATFSSQYGTPKVQFFTGSKPAGRLKAGIKALKLDAAETKEFMSVIDRV
jgi:hypothetical protein